MISSTGARGCQYRTMAHETGSCVAVLRLQAGVGIGTK